MYLKKRHRRNIRVALTTFSTIFQHIDLGFLLYNHFYYIISKCEAINELNIKYSQILTLYIDF